MFGSFVEVEINNRILHLLHAYVFPVLTQHKSNPQIRIATFNLTLSTAFFLLSFEFCFLVTIFVARALLIFDDTQIFVRTAIFSIILSMVLELYVSVCDFVNDLHLRVQAIYLKKNRNEKASFTDTLTCQF